MRGTPLASLAATAVLSWGCGHSDGSGTEEDAMLVVDGDVDPLVEDSDPDVPADPDAAAHPFINTFRLDLDGTGTIRTGAVQVDDMVGTVALGAADVALVTYEMTDWSEFGYVLFHVIAPQASTLNVMYLYCEADSLSWVWHEDFDRPMDYETATGACAHAAVTTMIEDDPLEALLARPTEPQLVTGVTVDGPSVSYHSTGPGTIRIEGRSCDLYPFEVVDCTTDCTADPADGWWELHSLIVEAGGRSCFGILYLMVADTSTLQLGYPVCLRPLEHLEEHVVGAAWSVEPGGGGGAAPAGPRPEGLGHVLRPLPPSLRRSEG
jgi:hypothetical protein